MALCALAATRWMVVYFWLPAASTAVSEAAGCGAAAAVVFALACKRGASRTVAAKELRWALAGAMLLCGPLVALVMAARVDPIAVVMALALTPIAAGVAQTALGGSTRSLAGRIWPGLAAIAGLLLLIPEPNLTRTEVLVALTLAPLLTGVGAAFFCAPGEEPIDAGPMRAVAALSGAAIVFAAAMLVTKLRGHLLLLSAPAALVDGLIAWLAVTALERVGTTRWTAQFTIVPLAYLLEGIVFVRPLINARSLSGLALLVIASVFLLLPPPEDNE